MAADVVVEIEISLPEFAAPLAESDGPFTEDAAWIVAAIALTRTVKTKICKIRRDLHWPVPSPANHGCRRRHCAGATVRKRGLYSSLDRETPSQIDGLRAGRPGTHLVFPDSTSNLAVAETE